ncbi:Peptide chain release factor class I/class II [Kalmanozyma brasiliensis GHG001]|uniref:Putative peptidyl-tRNA hydrolase n=1 Tax=Kalmanozyma brasiliensis (strain GHG001) TaxID=1365824 RepID=V5ERW5_KALBG|nr:Peptide chain release factor class I/class II [Kalmanozyma brasiliensis GHG001]EST04594.1 Peptide chain release factor class I/class II [Kalmanozyma brasiliensis GHG001]
MEERRRWVANFQDLTLRRSDFQVNFSRSSGPGGQNVNKLNTKANVRLDLSQAGGHSHDSLDAAHPRKWLNRDLVSRIAKKSPYYVASDHSMLVTSMRHRTQEANVQDALEKMHAQLLELAQEGMVGETSQQQRARVKRLQEAEARRKKQNKIKRADVKSGRKFKG